MRYKCPECSTHYTFQTSPESGVAFCPVCWVAMDEYPLSVTERVLRSDVLPDRLRGIAVMMSHNGRCE